MGSGSTSSNQNANGVVNFAPSSNGGGNIQIGGSVGNAGVSQGSTSQASGASVGLDLKMSMPGMDMPGMPSMNMGGAASPVVLINLQGLQNLNSEYVPFGPSAGEGWQTDLGDAMTDTAIAGAGAYKAYKASQPAIDALWKLVAPKSHDAVADKTFQAINDVKEIGKSMGGW